MGVKDSKLSPKQLSDIADCTEFNQKEIKDWFRGFKADYPAGFLTIDEFMKIYSNFYPGGDASAFANNAFRVFDHNKDGKIDFREFICGISMSMKGTFEEKMKWVFQLYDSNENGFISKDEMLIIVKSIHTMCSGGTQEATAEKQVESVYQKADTNADGQLSFDEFFELAKKDPTISNVLTGDMGNY